MEFIVTKVERGIDGLERFEIDVDLSLFSFGGDDFTAVDDEAVGRDFVVKLETLLGGGNGGQNRETVDTGFDVGSGALSDMSMSYIPNIRLLGGSYVFFS